MLRSLESLQIGFSKLVMERLGDLKIERLLYIDIPEDLLIKEASDPIATIFYCMYPEIREVSLIVCTLKRGQY